MSNFDELKFKLKIVSNSGKVFWRPYYYYYYTRLTALFPGLPG